MRRSPPARNSASATSWPRSEKQRKRHFLATHPSTPERVQDTARHAQGVTRASAAPITADRADLLARLDGLVIGADPVGGVFVEERFLQPHLDFSLAFPRQEAADRARDRGPGRRSVAAAARGRARARARGARYRAAGRRHQGRSHQEPGGYPARAAHRRHHLARVWGTRLPDLWRRLPRTRGAPGRDHGEGGHELSATSGRRTGEDPRVTPAHRPRPLSREPRGTRIPLWLRLEDRQGSGGQRPRARRRAGPEPALRSPIRRARSNEPRTSV